MARGILLSSDYLPPKMLLEYLGMIEDAGYDIVVVPEMWSHDAFTLIAQGLQTTSKLKFATGIVNIYSRSPGVLAMTAASLAELSDNRFILGLGASGPIVVEDFHGIPYGKPLQRTRETIQIIRTLLAGERANFDGEYFKLRNFKMTFTPEKPVPIWLASLGPKNLELTGELADGWYPIWATKSGFSELAKSIEKGLVKANKSRKDFTIAPFIISCASEKPELTTELAKKHIAYYIGKMGTFYYELAVRMGYEDEANKIRQLYPTDRDAAAQSISDKMIDDVAVTGSIDEARVKMQEWEKITDIPLVFLPYKTPPDIAFETMQAFAPKK